VILDKGQIPIIVDVTLVLSMFSLAFWTGTMANKVETHSTEIVAIQSQVNTLATTNNTAEIAAIKERAIAQQNQLADIKEFLGRRLDRIEQKLDNHR
jgi:hypothetical protein